MTIALTDDARELPGLRMAKPSALRHLGLETVADLLLHLPLRHEDRRAFRPAAGLREGEVALVRGAVESVRSARLRGRKSTVQAVLRDESGTFPVRWWNQPWLAKGLDTGTELIVFGKVRKGEISSPEYEILRDEESTVHVGRIVPIYALTRGVTQPALRRAVHAALEAAASVADPLPEPIRARRGLPPLADAVAAIHFPADAMELERARSRFRYDELFYYELAVAMRRAKMRRGEGIAHKSSRALLERIRDRFPFELTAAQARAAGEILADQRAPEPMNRLLQGDVGSGKTAVALHAALVAIANRGQVAFLAPTELLARQHRATIAGLLAGSDVRLELLVGSSTAAERRDALDRLAAGDIDLIVGTHALLEPGVEFARLTLVVVDEQHKFGVAQRAELIRKGVRPDVLVMTATPIPRTLALTAFGDLDVSIIDELPPGRLPPRTRVLPASKAEIAYGAVRAEAAAGRQAYVIFPLIEESEEVDARSAEEGFARLAGGALRDLRLALVTGRTPSEEREEIMRSFRAGRTDVLVGTTVLEVGVDVPNASVVVVESAERFGLSTLHQLRGRVGRGGTESFCFLVAEKFGKDARQRLKVMSATHDGFVIAEEDLRLRGPGEFFGTRQHGLPEFRVANLATDLAVLKQAREDAFALLEAGGSHPALRTELQRRFRGRMGLYDVG